MVRKAVIPAAGFGTRMLPAAKAVPKELLPVLERPTIQYVVEEAASAGVGDVLLVTSREKRAVEDHFDRSPELEGRLAGGGEPKQALLAALNELLARVKVHAVRQPEQRGLGDAVRQARWHVGDEPFLCLLGDTIFSTWADDDSTVACDPPAKQLVDAFTRVRTSVIGLEEIPSEKVSRYGIVGGAMVGPPEEGIVRLDALVEKPSPDAAPLVQADGLPPKRLAVAARYVLTPEVFECLELTEPGKGGEIQLTDALAMLLDREPIHGVVLKARRHDVGNPIDWLKTNLLFASHDPQTWAALRPMLESLLSSGANREEAFRQRG